MTITIPNYPDTKFILIDSGCFTVEDYYEPFALTDVLTTFAGINHQPIIHFWQLDQAMILGMKDTRVPYLKDGIASLEENHYQTVVRNAGGLGVIADEGVLNVSLILPNPPEEKITIDAAYELMWAWMKASFPEVSIEAYEITDSYCPGTYDLSIAGKKFAGIAQRRVKNGLAVMIYISVTGNQQARGAAVRQFYQAGLKERFGLDGYPPVNPFVMANLEDLLNQPLTIAKVKQQLLTTLAEQFGSLATEEINEQLQNSEWFTHTLKEQIEKMNQRNQLIKGGLS